MTLKFPGTVYTDEKDRSVGILSLISSAVFRYTFKKHFVDVFVHLFGGYKWPWLTLAASVKCCSFRASFVFSAVRPKINGVFNIDFLHQF